MSNVDQLNFEVILSDAQFDARINKDIENAQRFNKKLSEYLDLSRQYATVTKSQATANQAIIKANAQTAISEERIHQERQKSIKTTAQAELAQLRLNRVQQQYASGGSQMVKTLRSVNEQFAVQNRLISNVKTLFTSYVSLFALERAITSLARIRGEFELQQVALRAIMQDLNAADKVFSQLKGLAVESPFQFKELASYAKQLSAYNIANDELYDSLKRIADLSAGVGVSMDRLILAYGQVRSAEFLRGQEVRQFSEAGINLVGELADRFSQLEGRVVSAGEVFDRISKRMVTFEMVKEVIEDMTNEGGRFFDQQRIQAQTLAGQISNLVDAYQIMANDIGQANDGLLKGGVSAIRTLIQNWESVVDVIRPVIVTYGVYKAAVVAAAVADRLQEKAIKQKASARALDMFAMRKYLAAQTATIALQKRNIALTHLHRGALVRSAKSTNVLTAALWKLWAAMLKHPITAIITVLTAVGAAIYSVISATNRFKRELDSISFKKFTEAENEIKRFEELVDTLSKSAKGTKEYNDALSTLSNRFGKYLPQLDSATDKNEYLAQSIDKVTDAIKRQALIAAQEEGQAKINEHYEGKFEKYTGNLENVLDNFLDYREAIIVTQEFRRRVEAELAKGFDYSQISLKFRDIWNDIFNARGIDINMDRVYPYLLDDQRRLLKNLIAQNSELEASQTRVNARFSEFASAEDQARIDAYNKRLKEIADNASSAVEKIKSSGNDQNTKDLDIYNVTVQKLKDQIEAAKELGISYADLESKLAGLEYATTGVAGAFNEYIDSLDGVSQAEKHALKLTGSDSFGEKIEAIKSKVGSLQSELLQLQKLLDPATAAVFSPGIVSGFKNRGSEIEKELLLLERILSGFIPGKQTAGKNPRVEALEKEIELIKEAQAAYQKLLPYMGESEANRQIQTTFGIDFTDAGAEDQIKSRISALERENRDAGKRARDSFEKGFRTNSNNEILETVKDQLKEVEDYLKDYKTDFNFYQTLLGAGLDKANAIQLSFGNTLIGTPDLGRALADAIQKSMQAIGRTVVLDPALFLSFKDQLGASFETLPSEVQNLVFEADQILTESFRKRQEELVSLINEQKSTEQKIISIREDAARQIEQIDKDIADNRLDEQLGEKQKEAVQKWADDLIAQEEQSRLKLTSFYKRLFADIERQSTASLNFILTKASEALDNAVFNEEGRTVTMGFVADDGQIKRVTLSMEEYYDILRQIGTISSELSERNPFRQWRGAITPATRELERAKKALEDFETAHEGELAALERIGITIDSVTEKDLERLDITEEQKKLIQQILNLMGLLDAAQGDMDAEWLADLAEKFNQFNDILGSVDKMFVAISGNADSAFSSIVKGLGEASKGAMQIAQGVKDGNPIDIIQGVFTIGASIATTIAEIRNKRLEKKIKESERRLKKLESSYKDLDRAVEKALGNERYAYTGTQIENLKRQQSELYKQARLEEEKKGTDKDKVQDLKQQAKEISYQIEDLLDEIKESVLGSVADIASELGNALIDAFLQGEDAAAAWGDKVDEIVGRVIRNMIIQKWLEPKIGAIIDKYAEQIDFEAGGDVAGRILAAMPAFADDLMKVYEYGEMIFENLDPRLKELMQRASNAGNSLKEGIKAITEDTANLLASYVNAIRHDVSVSVATLKMIQQILERCMSFTRETSQVYVMHLKSIEANTRDNAESAASILQELQSVISPRVGGAGNAINVNA